MTTPTEELANKYGDVTKEVVYQPNFTHAGLGYCEPVIVTVVTKATFALDKLQAFREAVEAESDAERMKQDAIGEVVEDNQHNGYPWNRIRANNSFLAESTIGTKVYAKPFPSTEQLQQQVKELREALQLADSMVNDALLNLIGEPHS